MFQFFHWFYPRDHQLWQDVAGEARRLSELGVTAVWLPPAYKGNGGADTIGYDIYDLYDLGEFDQKGSVPTRYGTKEEYLTAINTLHEQHIQVYADIVLNHKAGADETEAVKVHKVNPENRNEVISDPYDIKAFTKFTFPGRGERYSGFKWDFHCFSGVDWDEGAHEKGVFKILNEYGDQWGELLGDEKGNFDYLMFADVEFKNPAVREEFKQWGLWYIENTGVDGLRLDAAKHIAFSFFPEWLDVLRKTSGKELFTVAEFASSIDLLHKFIEVTGGCMSLFDFPLHDNLRRASNRRKDFDLRKIFEKTLVASNPRLSVTFVENHDTQVYRETPLNVSLWFKPHSYSLILLREGGYPCVFHPDLYGFELRRENPDGKHRRVRVKPCRQLTHLLMARKLYAFGPQRDYFNHANLIGWVREGSEEVKSSGCAVLLSNKDEGSIEMDMGMRHAGKTFYELTESRDDKVVIGDEGRASFPVNAKSVAVWVSED